MKLAERMASKDHYVYRHYDADGRLLYVGCTSRPKVRPYQHKTKPWWHDVARTVFSEPMSYAAGLEAEFTAIRDERPLHNRRRWGHSKESIERDVYWARISRIAREAGLSGSGVVIECMARDRMTAEQAIDYLARKQQREAS